MLMGKPVAFASVAGSLPLAIFRSRPHISCSCAPGVRFPFGRSFRSVVVSRLSGVTRSVFTIDINSRRLGMFPARKFRMSLTVSPVVLAASVWVFSQVNLCMCSAKLRCIRRVLAVPTEPCLNLGFFRAFAILSYFKWSSGLVE